MTLGNPGSTEGMPTSREPTGYDLRHRFTWLNRFTDDELRGISFCDEHTPLKDGAQYFDISEPERGEIIGQSGELSPPGSCYVWRGSVHEHLWNKLLSFGKQREAGR